MKKLGLDIHGVIDTKPKLFVSLAKFVISHGDEVHIITGVPFDHEAWDNLKSFNDGEEWWTHRFSITEYLKAEGHLGTQDKEGRWHFQDKLWDMAKGIYCVKNNIDLHIDDSEEYGKYFSTSYHLFK